MARYVTYEIGGERYMVWALNGNLYAQHIRIPHDNRNTQDRRRRD